MEKEELKEIIKKKRFKGAVNYLIKNNYNFLLNNEEEKATIEIYNIFTVKYYNNELKYILHHEEAL
jgi:hypothetical protein